PRLLGTHWLIAGATGAGKGSVLWALIRALAGGIRRGLVQLWVIDPKGGMELAFGEKLFTHFVYGTPGAHDGQVVPLRAVGSRRRRSEDEPERRHPLADIVDLLERAVAEMYRRQAQLRGVSRLLTPSTDQ